MGRPAQLQPDQRCQRGTDQRHAQARDDVLNADDLVVRAEDVVPEEPRMRFDVAARFALGPAFDKKLSRHAHARSIGFRNVHPCSRRPS
jgi:hypothetical protein